MVKRRYKITLWIVGSLCSLCLALWATLIIWYLHSWTGLIVADVARGQGPSWKFPESITYFYVMDTAFGKRQLAASQQPLMALAISSVSGNDFSVEKPKRLIAIWTRLLDAGQPIDRPVPNSTGFTALELAALSGRPELVRFLIDHGANPNYTQLIYWRSYKKKKKITILDQTICYAKIFPARDYGPVIKLLVKAIKSRGEEPDFSAAQRSAKQCHPGAGGNEWLFWGIYTDGRFWPFHAID